MSLRRGFSPPRLQPRWLTATPETTRAPERFFALPARRALFATLSKLVPHTYDHPWGPVEHRHPLLGRSLVELMLRLPWEDLLQPAVNRVIQRRALRDVLPSSIRNRTDKGDFTMGVVFRFRSLVERHPTILTGHWLADLGIVDRRHFSEALERSLHGYVNEETNALFAATTFECWLQANAGSVALDVEAMDPVARWARADRGSRRRSHGRL